MKSEPISRQKSTDVRNQRTLKILHVDDNPDFIDLVRNHLNRSKKDFKLLRAANSGEALEKLESAKVDCILSDYMMPDKNGLELLQEVREKDGDLPFILLTGKGSEEIASKAMSRGATDYFKKKGKSEEYEILAQRIENAVSSYRARNQRNKTLKRITDGFIGLNKDYEIRYSNKKAEELLQLSEKDYKGKKLWKFYNNKEGSLKKKIKHAYEIQEEVSVKEFDPIRNRWFHISVYPSKYSISVYLNDITERERSQKQKNSQISHHRILAELGQTIVGIDEVEDILNEICGSVHKGIDCEAVKISGDDLKVTRGVIQASSSPYIIDVEIEGTKWGEIKVETSEKLNENEREFLESIKSVLTNALSRIEIKSPDFKNLIESSKDIIYLIDSDEEFKYINKAGKDMLGYSMSELNSMKGTEMNIEGADEIKQKFNEIKEGKRESAKVQEICRTKNGEVIAVETHFTDYEFGDGSVGRVGVSRNITEIKNREKELEKFERIVEASDEGLYLTNSQSEIEFANEAFLKMTGLTEEKVIGENISNVLELDKDQKTCKKLNKLIAGKKEVIKEKGELDVPKGDKLHYKNKFKLLYPEKDEFKGTLGLLKDITDHEEKRKDLKQSKNKSERERERLIENVPGAAFRIEDKDGKWELDYISEGVKSLLNQSPEQIKEKGWESLVIDEDLPKLKRSLSRSEDKNSEPIKFRVKNKDGKIRWVMAKGSPVNMKEDKEVIEGVLIDITDWKEYKKDLHRTQILVEASPEPMFILDKDLEIVKVNKAARDIVKVNKGDLNGKSIDSATKDIIASNKSDIIKKNLGDRSVEKYIENNSQLKDLKQKMKDFMEDESMEQTSFEIEMDILIGKMIYGRFELRKVFDEDGNVEGLAGVIHDLTDMEKKKRSQRNKLDEFSSLVSHDLRNPLNLAQGYLDLARESESEEDFEVIEKAHKRMENIIDELLLITTEKEKVEKEYIQLSEVFQEAFYFSGSKKLEYEVKDDLEIYGDRSGLVSIFENLINNSEEHNEGDVKIEVGTTEDGFYYEDDGKGIPEGKRDEIFEYGISSNDGGIGLSIVRRIAEINEWNIKACESENGGARFEIET